MPIHDWTRVSAGAFHHFHTAWIAEISKALNRGLLPREYYALAEQQAGEMGPHVLTLHRAMGAVAVARFANRAVCANPAGRNL